MSLLANILHPGKSVVSRCSLHNLHWLFSVSPLPFFQALVSVICSINDKMVDAFLGVKFCSSHILHFLGSFLYISLCSSSLLYCSSLFLSLPFMKHSFACVYVNMHSFSSIFSSTFISFLSNFIVLPCYFLFLFLFPSVLDSPIIWHRHLTHHI